MGSIGRDDAEGMQCGVDDTGGALTLALSRTLDAIAPRAVSALDNLAQQPILLGCDLVHVDADLLLAARREVAIRANHRVGEHAREEAGIAERARIAATLDRGDELADLALELVGHVLDQK